MFIPNVPHHGWIHREINSRGKKIAAYVTETTRLGFVCPCIACYTLGLCWWCDILNMFRFNISQPICLVPSSIHQPTHAISLYVCIYYIYIYIYIYTYMYRYCIPKTTCSTCRQWDRTVATSRQQQRTCFLNELIQPRFLTNPNTGVSSRKKKNTHPELPSAQL